MTALYTHTTRAPGTILTATIYNADHQNHIDNGVPNMHDDYSVNLSQMQSQVDPYPAGVASLPTSLAAELERIRYALAEIKGTTYWYEDSNIKGLDHIATKTLTGSSVDFEDGFGTEFDDMFFIIRDAIPLTQDTNLAIRFKTAGAYVASNYEYHLPLLASNSALYSASAAAAQGQILITPAADSGGTDAGACGTLWVPNTQSTAALKRALFHTHAQDNAGVSRGSIGWGRATGFSTALQGVRFLWSSGNHQGGEISQYGIRAS